MDYHKLLKIAEGKKIEAQYERSTATYCNTSIAPPKKVPKSNIQKDAIKKFLEKRDAEERQKAVEARKKKDELLSLRVVNRSKSKAKIMASRTKDNDFSKIRLSEDEVEAKKKREQELIRLNLNDKVARMKARIELEENEKLLPKKRKRKSKDPNLANEEDGDECHDMPYRDDRNSSDHKTSVKEVVRKKPRLPSLGFHELLELAYKKQFEPVKAVPIYQNDSDEIRPLSKKARKQLQEEENSIRRKLAAEEAERKSNVTESFLNTNPIKKLPKIGLKKRPENESAMPSSAVRSEKRFLNGSNNNKQTTKMVRKENDGLNHSRQQSTSKMPMDRHLPSANPSRSDVQKKPIKNNLNNSNSSDNARPRAFGEKVRVAHQPTARKVEPSTSQQHSRVIPSSERASQSKMNGMPSNKVKGSENVARTKGDLAKPKKTSNNVVGKDKVPKQTSPPATQKIEKPDINAEMLAEMENRIRNQLLKELEAKYSQKQESQTSIDDVKKPQTAVSSKQVISDKSQMRTNSVSQKPSKDQPSNVKKTLVPADKWVLNEKMAAQKLPQKSPAISQKQDVMKRPLAQKPKILSREPERMKKPQKPAFHPNPYLQPTRRLLVSQLPQRPRRRLESDDEDDEDDDDMKDFIDDECGDTSENYSQFIKEMYGYDRSRYIDEDDDDDIMETSFAEQMKEECRSAKIARKEDLEEELKERDAMRRKMMKSKAKSKKR